MRKIPYGYCRCGCGEKTRIAEHDNKRTGWTKGKPIFFIHRHPTTKGRKCSSEEIAKMSKSRKGEKNGHWKGGRVISGPYIYIMCPSHPRANPNGYIREHVLIAEKSLGKFLPDGTMVHHYPKVPSNQLVICENQAYHLLLHRRQRAFNACGYANWRKCKYCKKHDAPNNLYVSGRISYHRICSNKDAFERRHAKVLPISA